MHCLVTICRIHLVSGFVIFAKRRAGFDSITEWPIKAGRIFRRIGHYLDILKARVIQRVTDRRHPAIHHVGWCDNVTASPRLMHSLPA